MADQIRIIVTEQRPGWRAMVRQGDEAYRQTGGTVHAAVTKALADAGLVCEHHLAEARKACPVPTGTVETFRDV